MCSHKKDIKHIHRTIHSVACVMHKWCDLGMLVVKNLGVETCDYAQSTARSSYFSLCAISTQISNSGPNTHTNLRCIYFLICAGKSTYGRFMDLVVPHSPLDLAAVCHCGISRLCSLTFSKKKGYFHQCPLMGFLQTLHVNNSLYTNYENVFIELDS